MSDILVKIGADISDFSRKMAESNRALSNFSKANQQTFDSFKQVGTVVTGAGVAIAGGLGVAAKHAIDFESSFAGVRKTVDASEAEFAVLEKGIRDMSKELPASVHEINGVAEAAGQLGIKKENILDFTRTMIDLGESTNLSSEEAATSFARFANIVGMSQDDFGRLGSSVVELGNNLATTEAEIVAMAMRLAGVGNQVGMTEPQIMALGAAMSSVGIEAEAGGTAMSTVLKKMQNAVSSGGKDLNNFAKAAGMSSKEFATAFKKDPITALDAFIKNLAKSGEEGANLNEILDSVGIKGIREADTILRLAGASDILSEAVDMSTKAWDENTALSDEAAQRYETLASKLAILKNTLIDAGISIGQALMPAIGKVTEFIQKLVEKFNGLSEGTKQFIAIGAAAVSALMLIVGPILLLIGFIPQIISGFGAVMTVVKAVGAAFTLLTSPIGLIIAAVIAAVALIYIYWEPVSEFFINLWEKIKVAGIAVWDWLKGVWQSTVEFFVGLWTGISEFFSNLWNSIVQVATSIWDSVVAKWNEVVAFVYSIFGPLIEFYANLWTTIVTTASTIWSSFVTMISTVWSNIQTMATAYWEIIKNVVLGAILLLINLATGDFEGFKSNLQSIWNNIKSAAGTIWNAMKSSVTTIIGTWISVATNIWNGFKSTLTGLWNALKSTASNIWNALKTSVLNIISSLASSAVNAWNNLKSQVISVILRLVSDAVAKWESLRSQTLSKMIAVKDTIINTLKNINLMQIGQQIIQGFINGIKSKVAGVAAAAKSAADAVTGKIKSILKIASPSRVLAQIGRWTGEGLAKGIVQTTNLVGRATAKLAEAATPEAPAISLAYDTPSGIRSSLASAVSGTVDVNARDDMIAAAIDNLSRKLENMRIEMDRREMGRFVSDVTTEDRNSAVRGRGHRRING